MASRRDVRHLLFRDLERQYEHSQDVLNKLKEESAELSEDIEKARARLKKLERESP